MAATRKAWCGLVIGGLLSACARQPADPAPPDAAPPAPAKLTVVATIFPLADLTARLAGPNAEVTTLVPAGATPHTFSLKPQQARQIAAARVIVRVGPGYDDWLVNALEGSPAAVVVAMDHTDVLPLPRQELGEHHDHEHEHADGAGDPHLWLDPQRVSSDVLPAVAAALKQAMPGEAASIDQRLAALQQELAALESEIRGQLSALSSRNYIASHAGWQYWNQRFGLEQVASIEVVPGTEPSARWRKEVIDLARAKGVRAVFSEVQLPGAAAQALATDAGLRVLELDMLGGDNVDGRDSYAAMMRYNAAQFARGLADG